jgi:2-polyprenyl-3-methyl-5-hydroxy-6-metoxy-1,4-benzoquinol methylase
MLGQAMADLTDKNCDICDAMFDNSTLIAVENDYPIVECNNCGFVYVNQQPKEEGGKVIDEYYNGDEVEAQYKRYIAVNQFLLEEINRKVPTKGRFLDVGCGYGYLLQHMMADGWQAFGSELSQLAVDYVNKKAAKECVYYGLLPDLPFEKHYFTIINMTNVLEHVPSPTQVLLECKEKLSSSGYLFVRVPNVGFTFSFNRALKVLGLFGVRLADFSIIATPPPIHLQGFNAQSLKAVFEKTGFEVVEIKPSKLSNSKFYAVVEVISKIIYVASLRKINMCPTILAIARIKKV